MFKYKGAQASVPPGYVYIIPVNIFSKDENSENMRCGVLSFAGRNTLGQWFGYTVFQIFTHTWNPSSGFFNKYDQIDGKPFYYFEWATSATHDITSDVNAVKNVRKMGTVIKGLPSTNMAVLKLDTDFVDTRRFQEDGVWVAEVSWLRC